MAGPDDSGPARHRLETWRAVLTEAGREVPPPYFGDWTADSGYRAGQVLAADPAVTAVFCGNDEMAAGLLHAVHDLGRVVPDDISVVGFDNVTLASHLQPPLTTVDQDYSQIGRELVALLVQQMRDGEILAGARKLVPTTFVERASTAPPR